MLMLSCGLCPVTMCTHIIKLVSSQSKLVNNVLSVYDNLKSAYLKPSYKMSEQVGATSFVQILLKISLNVKR